MKNRQSLSLANYLDSLTSPGELYEALDGGVVRCTACSHRCLLQEGRRGICQVRINRDGELYVPHGYAAGIQADPIEKKPFFHVLPGADALTFGMLGCDMHCGYCQNWLTSQALRDDSAGVSPTQVSALQLVEIAMRSGAQAVVSSYNEPLITAEWAVEVFKLACEQDLICGFVSNGNATCEALDLLRPWTQCYKIDLKTMQDTNYRQLGAVLQNILDGIVKVHERGFWLEIVTLIVPGFNNSTAELREMADFIASVSTDIPWHVTAFHPDYNMREPHPTTVRDLVQAAEIGKEAGLHFVYAGNLSGRVRDLEHTYCPNCKILLVERYGYHIQDYRITRDGTCPNCSTNIPGLWHSTTKQIPGGFSPLSRRPRRISNL